jgi:Phage integrase, N-terminal SAM-like domain
MRPPRKLARRHGHVWEVRWRERGRHHSRVFEVEDDAVLFKAEIDRRRRRDRLCALGVGGLTLAEFSEWWWRVHVMVELQPSTRVRYRQVLDGHVLARLGQLRLREISPWVVLEFRAELSEAGVAPPTARKALFLLQAIMRLAVLRGAVEHNPAPEVCRDPTRRLLVDEHGPVGIDPQDRKYGQALMGGQGSGKTSAMAPGVAIDARDDARAIVVGDAKEELAKLALGLIPAHRRVHYIDLGQPEIGFNPLTIDASPGTRASVFLGALIEANPPGAIQARSDDLLRQAVTVVCAVEQRPTVWDVYRMLSPGDPSYREQALTQLDQIEGMDFARYYWRREFPELLRDRSRTLEVLDPPLNKLRRLLSTPQVDVVLRHPYSLDIEGAIARGEVIVLNGAKAVAGEDNTKLLFQLLLRLVHRAIQAQQSLPKQRRRRVSLYVDEAHNVLTPSVATLLAEGRSAGLEACFAWQYSAQVRDELVRSGVRSLLQSISIFRMRELEDARSLAGLAMDVYSDHISIDQAEQSGCASPPTTSSTCPSTAPSTSGSPKAPPEPPLSPKRCLWKSSTTPSSPNTTSKANAPAAATTSLT